MAEGGGGRVRSPPGSVLLTTNEGTSAPVESYTLVRPPTGMRTGVERARASELYTTTVKPLALADAGQ